MIISRKSAACLLSKVSSFHLFPGADILLNGAVSEECPAIRLKLCGNCAFPQNFHTGKLGEISVLYLVIVIKLNLGGLFRSLFWDGEGVQLPILYKTDQNYARNFIFGT